MERGTYAELFENVDEDFVRVTLALLRWLPGGVGLRVDIAHGPRDSCAGRRLLGENAEDAAALLGLHVFAANLGLNDNCVADRVLSDVLGRHELRVSIVNDLVDDFIDEYEVLADALLVEHATVISKDFHHAINDVHDERRRHVVLGRGHEVDAELLGEEIVEAMDVLQHETHGD